MIAAPPSEAGAVQLTVACALPPIPVTPVGAPGSVAGVTALDTDEVELVPAEFVATTVNVYEVPLVSPVTVVLVAGMVAVKLSGFHVTV